MDDRAPGPQDPTEPIEIPPRPPQPDAGTAPISEPEAKTLPLPVIAGAAPAPAPAAPASVPPAEPAPVRPPARRRHRGVAALITTLSVLVVLVVVGVVGWFAGNAWAKDMVIDQVTQHTRTALGLESTAQVDVQVAEPMLPQLISGSLDTLTVTVPDAPIGAATGELSLHATGVPTGGDGAASSASITARMSPKAIATLAGDLGRTVPGSLRVVGKNITVGLDPSQFLSGVSFTLTLRPSAADGKLVLTPIAFEVAGAQVSADVIRARFGTLADGILADRTVCVADRFPKGMTMSSLELDSRAVVAGFTVDPHILTDASLQKPGSCR